MGCLPIDRKDTERDLRGLTIGESKGLFAGSMMVGKVAATMHTLAASAPRHRLDQWASERCGPRRATPAQS